MIVIIIWSLCKIFKQIKNQPGLKYNFLSFVLVFLIGVATFLEFCFCAYVVVNMYNNLRDEDYEELIRITINQSYVAYMLYYSMMSCELCALYMIFTFKITVISREFN